MGTVIKIILFSRSAWILKPDSLPSSYISFLNKHGGKDVSVLKTLRELAFQNKLTDLESVKGYYKSMGMDAEIDPNMSIPCTVSVPISFSFVILSNMSKYIPKILCLCCFDGAGYS
jgi:hypothetical protein